MDIFNTVTVKAAGISADHPLADVISGRSDLIELTQASHDAALIPDPSGGFSHSERAALACRISRLNKEDTLAQHYAGMIRSDEAKPIADTAFDGGDDARWKAIIRHTDLVTVNPKEATDKDITALQSAGLLDDDIVRLSEIIAFVSYQFRVVAGLRLMGEAI